ncbi:restriction endonuclease subunit S [Methylopila sp. M107]|uniref:restriction endonuclease subunit S n=1 Tax=Methylopila sp. M107 TaxID=1101190 RepID=UPI000688EC70|nr:restriction endonuclease subunit S [Methylopila sp. M107]
MQSNVFTAFAQRRQLGELLEFRSDIVHPKDNPKGEAVFVGLEHIERDTGIRTGSVHTELSEMTGRRARFCSGDIVYGYLRPYLNKVWIAEFDGICSVDQYVFTVKPDFDRNYVAHFLRSNEFLKTAPIDSAPGQLPRIRSGEIAATPIPLPPLDEQRRIAAILDKADALRRKRKCALDLLDGLTQSIFTDRFGVVDDLAGRDDLVTFGELVDDGRIGLVRSADELSTEPGLTPYVRMDAISLDGRLSLSPIRYTRTSASEQSIYELAPDDFLFNTRNSKELVGKIAVFDGPDGYVYNNNILRIRFTSRAIPHYVQAFFQTRAGKNELEVRKAGTTSVFAIYQKALYGIPVAVPPVSEQQAFAEQIRKIGQYRKTQEQHHIAADLMFASLQHRAFSGQL